jgi:hypothetical protein
MKNKLIQKNPPPSPFSKGGVEKDSGVVPDRGEQAGMTEKSN